MTSERDYKLRQYIEKQQRQECEGNAADHRPTSQYALDEIVKKADKLHARGREFMDTVSREEIAQMRAYHTFSRERRSWTSPDDLVSVRIGEKWMLVPFFMADIETARKLRTILCGTS